MNNRKKFHLHALLLAISAAFVAPNAVAVVSYDLTDLGALTGYPLSVGYAVNSDGDVAGFSYHNSGFYRAILYSNGVLSNLVSPVPKNLVLARGLNDPGDVVGHIGSQEYIATLWKADGTKTMLGNLPGGSWSVAWDINNAGQITGSATTSGTAAWHAFLYENGSMTDLGTLGGSESRGIRINANGDVAGYAQTTGNSATHAVLYRNGDKIDLGTLGGTNSYAATINDLGQVAGDSEVAGSGDRHAFIWNETDGMVEIGTLGGAVSYSYGINNAGTVVGQSQITDNSTWHAFVYENAVLTDLNDRIDAASGWVLNYAYDINDKGQITGMGTFNGLNRAYLLTPVPEPETYALMLAGLGLVGFMARRRRVGK